MWGLARPGIEPMLSALGAWVLTTGPEGTQETLFFRTVLRSQQNWAESTEISHNNTNSLPPHKYNLPIWWFRWLRICLQYRRPRFKPWVRKILWRRKWQPNPVFLPGEFHGQRSLVGYSPWVCKELDMTERLTFTFITSILSPRVGRLLQLMNLHWYIIVISVYSFH